MYGQSLIKSTMRILSRIQHDPHRPLTQLVAPLRTAAHNYNRALENSARRPDSPHDHD